MCLHSSTPGRIAFDKAAIMRRAYEIGRHALRLSRARRAPAAERNAMLSRFLSKAWAEAKAEVRDLARRAERNAADRLAPAERARENAALAATFGNDRTAIRWEIERENYRQHFNPARIDALRGALSSIGA
jgi:hypothetical protein